MVLLSISTLLLLRLHRFVISSDQLRRDPFQVLSQSMDVPVSLTVDAAPYFQELFSLSVSFTASVNKTCCVVPVTGEFKRILLRVVLVPRGIELVNVTSFSLSFSCPTSGCTAVRIHL